MWFLEQKIDTTENYAFVNNALTKYECQQIISLGESLIPKQALIQSGANFDVRNSNVSWILPSTESEWVFRKMTDFIKELNDRFFKFDIDGFDEGFQFTKYQIDGKYEAHIDKTYYSKIRKLSMVVQLSDPCEYEGGDLSLFISKDPFNVKKKQGFMVAFPSYTLHKVNPVTNGTRYSLVAWLTGPAFK